MARRIITMLTLITTEKKDSSTTRTKRPVIGRPSDAGLVIGSFLRDFRSRCDEMICGGCGLAEADICDAEFDRHRLLGFFVERGGDQHAHFGGLVAAKNDHRPIRDDGVRADHMDLRTRRSVDFERNDAVKTALVEKTKRVAVADRPVAQLDSN